MKLPVIRLVTVSIFLTSILSFSNPIHAGVLPNRYVIPNVPYVEQMKNYCGPAALTSVLNYWGQQTDQNTVGKNVFDASIQATNGADMLLYARSKGLSAYSWNSSMADLKCKLKLGVPVIVLQDCTLTDPSGHYRVATGYDDEEGVVFVNDPYEPQTKSLSYAKFETLWSKHGYWGLLVCPKTKDSFKKDLNDKNPVVHIDLAYIYYKRGDLKQAEQESRLALSLEPGNYTAKDILDKSTKSLVASGKK